MAEPTKKVRDGTYQRDGHKCIRCGRRDNLSYQHRQAVGMGGSKRRPSWPDGLTACLVCNMRFETDLQDDALRHGWKVPRWVKLPELVPVWDVQLRTWFLLSTGGAARRAITQKHAQQLQLNVYGEVWPNG